MRYLIWIPSALVALLLIFLGANFDQGWLLLVGLVVFLGGGIVGVVVDERAKRRSPHPEKG